MAKIQKDTIADTIRTLHTEGLVTDRAIAARLGVDHRTIHRYRKLAGIPPACKLPVSFDRRHGPGAYATLVQGLADGVSCAAIGRHFAMSREAVSVLRVRILARGVRGRTTYTTGGVRMTGEKGTI